MKRNVFRSVVLLAALVVAACGRREVPGTPPAGEPPPPVAPAPGRPVVRIGVILPQSGQAQAYAESILEGIRLAVAEHEAAGTHRVQLVVRDDSGRAAAAGNAMREMVREDVHAVIGPLTDGNVTAAARARAAGWTDLAILAPMAIAPATLPNVYAMNVEDTIGAAALGRYAATRGRAGVLHVRSAAATAEARAFARAVSAGGGAAPLLVPFDAGTTNFATHIRRLRDARATQVFVAAGARQIRQIIPQLGYYGLANAQVLGGEAWAAEDLRRELPRAQLEGVIVATVLPRTSAEVNWAGFEQAYGMMYRRAPTSPIPALGYDAAKLLLRAAGSGAAERDDIARALAGSDWYTGATGVMRLRAGAAIRRPFLMRIRSGALEPVVTSGGS